MLRLVCGLAGLSRYTGASFVDTPVCLTLVYRFNHGEALYTGLIRVLALICLSFYVLFC